ncbi:D-mannonate epimerase [candidate division KSB3 bacterium]|uniref:D-mannonate epimerase n=1 Tax=candidate division KSB3 bacterium TaxID=2044937 RepID=A0A2G6EBG4_9BACT|nr:MAG: D-mannonate epimerase [candidate division KSB3 bacterium]PIE30740.1 MAG: D-mannonate epimerase [candidate division KSB3 bacterium]
MATLFSHGGPTVSIDQQEKERSMRNILGKIIEQLGTVPKRVLLLPPDMSRFHSDAGNLIQIIYTYFSPETQIDIMPAIGTHYAMTEEEIREMYGTEIPLDCFKEHDWRNEVTVLGEVPPEKIREFSEGALELSMEVGVNNILLEGNYDLILSIGQIVPHEVIGMANFTKNVCVGVGGADMINKSHFLGAVYGMEKIMGRIDTPVRNALDHAFHSFLGGLPVFFIMTVMAKEQDQLVMRGLFCGDKDGEAFRMAARLSQQVNLDLLDERVDTMVVYLDPSEFKSTWIGNKAVYRTRLVMADGGKLIILAPGLKEFGEDPENDRLIRKYGYRGTPATLEAVKENEELQKSLGAAAHLIHGSSEGRFSITYCPGPGVSQAAIESVGYQYANYDDMIARYNPKRLQDGWNTMADGEKVFYVSNPALGLWALKEHFEG